MKTLMTMTVWTRSVCANYRVAQKAIPCRIINNSYKIELKYAGEI